MMYCSTKETNASNIYRLATILKKKKIKCVSTSSHTLFPISLAAKMGQQHFFSLVFPLNP